MVALACDARAIEAQRMRATGYAEITGNDMAGARERALDAALRAAVETAAVRAFGTARVGADAATFEKRVLGAAREYVNGYQVVSEGVDNGGGRLRYQVVLEAEVALAWIEEVLDPPREAAAPPMTSDEVVPSMGTGASPAPVYRAPSARDGVELQLGGELTGVRYRELVAFLQRDVPGVDTVLPVELAPGSMILRVTGSFAREDLGGYLASANLPGFRLRLSAAPRSSPLGPDRLLVRVEGLGPEGWR